MTENSATDELKPCPFCGGEAMPVKQIEGRYAIARYSVSCNGCGLVAFYEATEAEAIAAWNTRTATTDAEFARAVHDGNLWRRVNGHIRCRNCGLNIESVIALDGCNEHAIKHCPNCGHKVVG